MWSQHAWVRAWGWPCRDKVFQVAQMLKTLPAMWETQFQYLGQEDPLEKGTVTHSSILAQRIPGTKEPGGPQSIGLQRVRHD